MHQHTCIFSPDIDAHVFQAFLFLFCIFLPDSAPFWAPFTMPLKWPCSLARFLTETNQKV